MTELFLYDDAVARRFEPFALTRPAAELRAGALLLRERWEHALGVRAAGMIGAPHLADFDERWRDGLEAVSGTLPAGSILANSRCAVALARLNGADVWRCDGRVAAVLLPRAVDVGELREGEIGLETLARSGGRSIEVTGRWIDHVWDFIATLNPLLGEDIAALGAMAERSASAGRGAGALGIVAGAHGVFAEREATIEPQVYFDTAAGPVLVRRGAVVHAFTRIVGPCVIGIESQVGGDRIAGSAIGDVCKVHGEMSTSILVGHANKAHDGFVGHSYLGRWVNLGAGTTTSNLKNTYSAVEFWTPDGEQPSGQQFLGTFFGDHTKTGIGTVLNTGTVIGAGANIFGGAMPPKVIPPFAWGERAPYSTYRLDKFLDVARLAMARRHVELSERQIRQLTAAFERRWSVDTER